MAEKNSLIGQQSSDNAGFDILEWLFKILNYWYLFVIAAGIALTLAFLQNRKWIPQYLSAGTILIKESSNGGYGSGQGIMTGFGVDVGYRNVNNQVIMLSSYDLLHRTVDSLPQMRVDYITQGRFKTRNIYKQSPFVVEIEEVMPMGYGYMFEANLRPDGLIDIKTTDENNPFSITTAYGQRIETEYFVGRLMPTEYLQSKGKIYFRFRDTESLINDFSGRLSLHFVTDKSTVLQISLISDVPERDRDFIAKLSEIYLMENLERKNEAADKSIAFISEQIELLQQSLVVSEGAMTDFRQKNKFVDVGSYAGGLMAKMASYDEQELQLRLKETYLDYLTNYLDSNIDGGGIIVPSALGLNEGMLMSLVQQLNDLNIQRGELSEKNVYYAKYTKDIENVKIAIREVVNSMQTSLDIERNDLAQRVDQVQKEVKNLPEKELEMVAIERNYRIDDNYYTFFLQKRAEAEIQKASNTPDNAILDKPRTLALTNASQKSKTTSRYLLIGLLIPLIIIVVSELINNKVRTIKEAERLSKFPLIGSVRHTRSADPVLVKSHPRSSYSEMLRQVRTRIEFIVQRKTGITVAITSTMSGDGKTYLSTNLAALYAMTGKKTLLIDMDIRKPDIHEKLGLDSSLGVTNYLIGDCELDEIINTSSPYDFDILEAGTIPPNPGELIRSEKLSEMLNELKKQYEYIVIDSSPVGQVPDANALIEQSDVTLYVVRCMRTNRFFAKSTLEQLYETYSDKVKVILSDIPTKKRRLGYGYGYGYGGYGSYGYGYGYGYGSRYGYGSESYGRYGIFKKNKSHNYADDEE